MALTPTAEQQQAIDLFKSGQNLAIEAGAGTGKTATLIMLAEAAAAQGRIGQYLAFNRAIVNEAGAKLPGNTTASTAHSLAFRAVGKKFAPRLRSPRMKSMELARRLRMDPLVIRYGEQSKPMAAGYLAGLTMRAVSNFCQSADPEPAEHHVPYVDGIDVPHPDGGRGWTNNRQVRAHVMPAVRRAWADVCDPQGQLPYKHDFYLKVFERSAPRIAADFILFDEAQDASPVLLSIVQQQTHAQLVFVGDGAQAIYGFTGAVNALDRIRETGAASTMLQQSFRFGQAVADVANGLLERLDVELRLVGNPDRLSVVASTVEPDAILTRTNAVAVETLLAQYDEGRRAALVGGGAEVAAFARAAQDLMAGKWTSHPDLACFADWSEVRDYCLAPGTRVLGADLVYRPIESLVAGDELVGFDEEAGAGPSGRTYQPAVVEFVRQIERPCWKLTFEDGTAITCSVEHRWIVSNSKANLWRETRNLKIGDRLPTVGTWEREETHDAGWLAGMFDGEGWIARRGDKKAHGIGISQNPGPVMDRIQALLKERGFEFSERLYARCARLYIQGGFNERLRLFGTLRPIRLMANALPSLWGCRMEGRHFMRLTAIEDVGMQTVVSVQTSTRTFIAEGLHSHNCDHDEQGGELRLMVKLVDDYGAATIIDAIARAADERSCDVTVSTAHKSKGREWPTVKLAGDFSVPRNGESDCSADELRLLYVACTRAQRELDVTLVPQALAVPEAGEKLAPAVDVGSVGEHLAEAHAVTSPATLAMHEVLHAEGASHEHAASTVPAGYSGAVVTRGPVEVGQ